MRHGLVLGLTVLAITAGFAPPSGGAQRDPADSVYRRAAGDDPLVAYFEVYHLRPETDGQARFEYEYTVHSEEKDTRSWIRRLLKSRPGTWHYVVHSEEASRGPRRRQFITVPVRSLSPGRYRLEIKVRDLIAGGTTVGEARFERAAPPPLDGGEARVDTRAK